eukprot:s7865_g2.t1
MAAKPLHELFDQEKLIKKRFKVKGFLVDFPPPRSSGNDDEEKKENPISTQAMEMNVVALKVMFSFYKVTSGKKAQPVRELFAIIKALRDAEDGEASADSSAGGEGEEEEDGEDDPVSEESENPRSVARVSDKAVEDQDDGGGVKAVLGDLGLKPNEDAPAPAFRYRSKSTLSSLALGGPNSRDILETPGSYKASLPDNTEEELQRILEQIRLYEDGESKDPDTARHDALLLMMGSPARPGTSRGLA